MVLVENLTKTYSGQKVLNNISFEVQKGEIVGLLGPNGAGKSTTMKIATGYISTSQGAVFVNGKDVSKEPLKVKNAIGYLPEHNPLYLDMYIKEYLHFIGSLYGLSGRNLKDRINKLMKMCGITPEKNKRISMLSKGYRQRVGIAQSLINNPNVLILDEPTSGLDPNQIVEIRRLIKKISSDKVVIFSTHIMQEVQALCSRVIIINKGEKVIDCPVSELNKFNSTTPVVHVEFDTPVDINLLKSIPGINEVIATSETAFDIEVEEEKKVRNNLFNKAVLEGWSMKSFNQKNKNLEEIFQLLTNPKD